MVFVFKKHWQWNQTSIVITNYFCLAYIIIGTKELEEESSSSSSSSSSSESRPLSEIDFLPRLPALEGKLGWLPTGTICTPGLKCLAMFVHGLYYSCKSLQGHQWIAWKTKPFRFHINIYCFKIIWWFFFEPWPPLFSTANTLYPTCSNLKLWLHFKKMPVYMYIINLIYIYIYIYHNLYTYCIYIFIYIYIIYIYIYLSKVRYIIMSYVYVCVCISICMCSIWDVCFVLPSSYLQLLVLATHAYQAGPEHWPADADGTW